MLQTNNHYARKQRMMINQDHQCNCFGYAESPQKTLLSKHRSLELKNKPSQIQSNRKQELVGTQKSPGKRSLRKNIKQIKQTPLPQNRNVFEEYYTPQIIPQRMVRKETIQFASSPVKNFLSPQLEKCSNTPINRFFENSSNQRHQINYGSWQRIPIQKLSHPRISQFQPPPHFIISNKPSPSPPPIKINFNSSPTKYSPQISPRDNKMQQSQKHIKNLSEKQQIIINPLYSLQEIKEEIKFNIMINKEPQSKHVNEEIVEFELTEDNLDSPRMMPVHVNRLNFDGFGKNQHLGSMIFKSNIIKPKSKHKHQKLKTETNKSKIDSRRSYLGIDTAKSKIALKSLRDEKRTLKKMDDVQEIRSMMDSSQFSDDDKQSIVLGRLHQYGSMVQHTDPTNSLTTPSLTSKLISMNTQNSAIQKSLLKFSNLDRTNYR